LNPLYALCSYRVNKFKHPVLNTRGHKEFKFMNEIYQSLTKDQFGVDRKEL